MQIIHVFIEVLPDQIEAFRQATIANAGESRKEAGVLRFDIFQEEGNPAKFLLIEIYKDADGPALHRQTAHYETWRSTVASMMAQQRYSTKYVEIFPADEV